MIQLEFPVLSTDDQLSVMNNENTHQAQHHKADDHVKESCGTPNELEHDQPENAFANCADETSHFCHVAFCEAGISGQANEHTTCGSGSLENGVQSVVEKDDGDQVSMCDCVSTKQNVVCRSPLEFLVVAGHSDADSDHDDESSIIEPKVLDHPDNDIWRVI